MFNLIEAIAKYNQTHQTKIKPNKTWGLTYLQFEGLAVLNNGEQLTEKSVYHASHFVTNRKALREALAKTKKQPTHQSLPTLKDIVRQLKTDQSILDRFNWEEVLYNALSQSALEQRFNEAKVENDTQVQQMLVQTYKQWKIHEPFQYHSSQGLLFLLDVITQYQYHFSEAQKELAAKQKAWIRAMRLPTAIAENYEYFLLTESNKLVVLKEQVIEALLLRLKAIEAQGQVTCDDVSYTFAKCIPSLGLPDITLPSYQLKLNNVTFNQIQRAIEKHGDVNQKEQLYQLDRYQLKEYSFIIFASHRLLIPKPLKKWIGLFFNHHRLQFLETQQALLAQLSFAMVFDVESSEALTLSDPALQIVITRHELLQQSLQLLIKQQPKHWWQWQQKCWHNAWKAWLIEQIHNNQGCLYDCLAAFSQHIQSHKERLHATVYREKVQATIQHIQTLIGSDPSEHQDILLTSTLEHLSILLQEKKVKKNNTPIFHASDTLLQSFKEDVSAVLSDYTQYYHDQGTSTPRKSFPDVISLWSLILNPNDNDIVKFGEELTQRYRAMQPVLFKWMPALDFNVLRRNLKTVLDNPKYSMQQLKLAAQSQVEQAIYQETDELSESYSDSDSLSSHSSWEEIESLPTQVQPPINNPEHSPYFFKNSFKFTEQPSNTFTVRATA